MALLQVAWHSAQSLSYDPFSIVAAITLVTRVASRPYTLQGLELSPSILGLWLWYSLLTYMFP